MSGVGDSGGAFSCARCSRPGPRLGSPPLPGEAGRELAERICAACWQEWEQAEVMVINELRLNFMDPKAQETLQRQMRAFLLLDDEAPSS